jgi:hypothetical protein
LTISTTTFQVHNSGFGTDESANFTDYRTRSEFTWLNGTTVLLDDIDVSQTVSLPNAGISDKHPVLSVLNNEQRAKEIEKAHATLFTDGRTS